MPEASIIIRTYNEARHLPALFDALERQGNQSFEVIVVDSGSIDETRDIAVERGAQLIRINKHDFTFGYSLNIGIRAAQGQFAVAVSAHTEPCDGDWLENLIAPLRDGSTAMTYGRQLGVRSSKFSECEDFRRIFGTQSLNLTPPDFFANNANSAIRRDLWESYPFDETLTGLEDIDWAKHWMEKGYQVRYVPNAPLYHIHEETWAQVDNRYYREAVAMRRISLLSRRNVPAEMLRECAWLIADCWQALASSANPAAARLTLARRYQEILQFRWHKAHGIARGLLTAHPMETASEREALLFDRGAMAVRIHAPGEARLEGVEIPEVRPGEALVRVANVAVCATDLEIFHGTLGYYRNGTASYPITPGHEFSGHVVSIGTNVTNLKEGTPVVVECIQSCGHCAECQAANFLGCADRTELGVIGKDGAYADFVSVPAQFAHPLPQATDMRKATLCEPIAVCLKGLHRLQPMLGNMGPDQKWAVVGAGPLGHIFGRILESRGVQPMVFDKSEDRLGFFQGSSITASSDLSELRQCNVIVEATGSPDALFQVLHESPTGAIILLLGLPYGEKSFSFEQIAAYDKTVIGSVGSTKQDFSSAIDLLPLLNLDALLVETAPLQDFEQAWAKSKQGNVFKVTLDIN